MNSLIDENKNKLYFKEYISIILIQITSNFQKSQRSDPPQDHGQRILIN